MALRFPLRFRLMVIVATLLLATLTLARQGFVVEPDSLIVREYALEIPSWPSALDGFRIAAVGDIHGGAPFVDEGKIEEVVRRVSAARPDLIVWLGDYVIQGVVGGTFMPPETVAGLLSKAQGRYGQLAILGNHDRWLDGERVERAFLDAGVPFLRGRSTVLVVNGVRLHIHGLDDFELSPGYWPSMNTARKEWRAIPVEEPLVVLSHNPDVFPFLPARVALTLASHTHGGQVHVPFFGSLVVPSSFGQRFVRGHIVEVGRHLFVNTGIGTSIIPVRLGVPPEVSVLNITHRRAP